MAVTEISRARAVLAAQAIPLGRTAVAIQDGCCSEKATVTAFDEFLLLHRNCPCCRGSVDKAIEVAKNITFILNSSNASEK